jgi:leucyl aminopeptidase
MLLDIACVAFEKSNYAKNKSASCFGVQLITTFIKDCLKSENHNY